MNLLGIRNHLVKGMLLPRDCDVVKATNTVDYHESGIRKDQTLVQSVRKHVVERNCLENDLNDFEYQILMKAVR